MIPYAMSPLAYRTYSIRAPIKTHWTGFIPCSEYQCDAYLIGWETVIDERTELGRLQGEWIRSPECGRKFTEERDDAGMTRFRFEPGQQGFASSVARQDHARHRRRIDRPEVFIDRDGNAEGNPTGRRYTYKRPEDWIDAFANHQDRIRTLLERG